MVLRTSEGRIVTFYSYKGGVGRTMALANVAFLAALNGHRVLVMDWDLEAPGLHYYFRGLMEAREATALRESPGVLDLLWDWSRSLDAAHTAAQTEAVFQRFDDPAVFDAHTHNVMEFGDNGCLDFLNAGSPLMPTTSGLSQYEDALALFNWQHFFAEQAGGSMLEHLRYWAKAKYDFVLIDSRTGLADVSGICTTQIPDAVVLCFVLNRQNIDGVARVASAIRKRRNDEITIHAAPMRVALSDTGEEADARARAIHELIKVGKFSSEAVLEDFRLLSVRAANNVPYYEIPAPIIATEISTDPLTLNYVRLAGRLLGVQLDTPELPDAWVETVRRRLQPRHATIDYIAKLTAADPLRAVSELEGLLESAFEAVMDGDDLSDDYVVALVEASLAMSSQADSPSALVHMLGRTLDLLRALAADAPTKWRDFLTAAIERHLEEANFYLEADEELALLEELDGLLASSTTADTRLRRIASRRRAAQLYIMQDELDAALQTVGEMQPLLREFRTANVKLASDQLEQLRAAEIDSCLLRGIVAERQNSFDKAHREFASGLKHLEGEEIGNRGEFPRLAFDLHSRLARLAEPLMTPRNAAEHAVQAVRFGVAAGLSGPVTQFVDLANIVTRVPREPELSVAFCEFALDAQERRGHLQYGNYYGRVPRAAAAFFAAAERLAAAIGGSKDDRADGLLVLLAETAVFVWRALDRRRHTMGDRQRQVFDEPLREFTATLRKAGLESEHLEILSVLATRHGGRKSRPVSDKS